MKTRVLALLIATILAVSASAQIAPVYSLSAPNAGGGADFLRFDLNTGTQTLVRHFNTWEMMTMSTGATYDYDHDRYIGAYVNSSWQTALVSIDVQTGNIVHDFVPTQVDRPVGVYGDGLVYTISQDASCRATLWSIHLPTRTETLIRVYNAHELTLVFGLEGYDREQGVLYGQDFDPVSERFEIVTLDPATGQVLTREPLQDWRLNGLYYTPLGVKCLGTLMSSDGRYNTLLDYDQQNAALHVVQSYLATDSVQIRAWGGEYDYQYQRIIAVEGYTTDGRILTALDAQTGALLSTLACTTHQVTDWISTGELPVPAGRSDAQQRRMLAYPNPTYGEVTLSGLRPGSSYLVLDALGHAVAQGRVTEAPVDLSDLPAGAYLLQVREGAHLHTQRLFKQ